MYRLYHLITDRRTLMFLGLLAAAGLLAWGVLQRGGSTAWWLVLAVLALALGGAAGWIARRRGRKSGRDFDELVAGSADTGPGEERQRAETQALRERINDAVRTIKQSRLGQSRGRAALYDLPWYVIIGNPAAGKSSAILNSGLQFPFADERGSVIQGIGGTRNCDWYFTTEGIVLDTAGRYSVSTEDRFEWMTFLDLLRKHRPASPINGILIAASVAELTSNKPEFAIDLAKKLRQRVQELTERLEVFAPVYVVFTKADLIAGFIDFFDSLDPAERENAWGATLPFDPKSSIDAVTVFDHHFDQLSEGLKEMGLAQMAMRRGHAVAAGTLTLPLEFSAIKPMLRIFIATLFEDNPYQFRPVFRGFYFTSALQEGAGTENASEKIARRFDLEPGNGPPRAARESHNGYFLLNLFRKVVFADRQLVRQYSHRGRTRLRHAVFLGAAIALGLAFTAWAWSYTGNRQLVADVEADLQRAQQLQVERTDLGARLEALEIIQLRLEQLAAHRDSRPAGLGFGLYQGARIERQLSREHAHGMRELMLQPVTREIEAFLEQVVARSGDLRDRQPPDSDVAAPGPSLAGRSPYVEASPIDAQDAYNALKAYLMLADAGPIEPVHLRDQVTRFWRGWLEANRGGMAREEMIRSVERLLSFHIDRAGGPDWPALSIRRSLVEDSRRALREVRRGESARDRVYADIKARAATRFAPSTVASLLGDAEEDALAGSHAVPGTFSRHAWREFVRDAIGDAAQRELSSSDWVLDTVMVEDLTLSGSPELIRRELVDRYKQEYAQEWRRFLQGLSVAEYADFEEAVARMNRLGDPGRSPLKRLLEAVAEQTGWDAPAAEGSGMEPATGFRAWFARVVLRRGTASTATAAGDEGGDGDDSLSRAFAGISRVVDGSDGGASLLDAYLQSLAQVRTRLNAIANEGDPGPGSRRLVQQTLDGASELSQALHQVDERMLNDLDEAQRQTLRPLLLRPLVQTFSALIAPTEAELNRTWEAQVHAPFQRDLADRYPFAAEARVEAASSEVARLFGPNGAIARFGNEALGPLVVRRGNTLTPRQWADMGISLAPSLILGFADWVEMPGQEAGADAVSQTVFQIRPHPAYGVAEYSLEIDGQRLRYRNTPPQWTNFVWPVPDALRAARVSAVGFDGRSIELAGFAGDNSLTRLFAAAERTQRDDGTVELLWRNGQASVTVDVKVISSPGGQRERRGLLGLQLPARVAGTGAEDGR